MLELERLEDRITPNNYGFNVQQITIPAQFNDAWSQMLYLRVEQFIGQPGPFGQLLQSKFGPGLPWSANHIYQIDETPGQAASWGNTGTTARTVLQMGDYIHPPASFSAFIFASPGTYNDVDSGIDWELDSLHQGWWYQDWGGIPTATGINYDHKLMPPGPQYGQNFNTPPNYFAADVLILQGNENWWWMI